MKVVGGMLHSIGMILYKQTFYLVKDIQALVHQMNAKGLKKPGNRTKKRKKTRKKGLDSKGGDSIVRFLR